MVLSCGNLFAILVEIQAKIYGEMALYQEHLRLHSSASHFRCRTLLALSSMFAIVVRLIPAFVTVYGMLGVLMYEYAAVGDPRLASITYRQANFYNNNYTTSLHH
ncbi:hypothetical protein PC129_g1081 [Phytophthora cactorum]|uniref:Uncharacterized protein n=1 Tax=Phytophthora cactorum TaxID=29920 RepID=A0A8T1LGT9_9STRA|nr:hypothetical protein PC112_g4349 [Phytophthora cactorum]KAG2840780.1 hypothetical protein PC111_g3337 [Phytophthora cactorum]KAG2864773.1 hypothetical protein PC113_g4243 [Phytophthora cactorum]KAG2923842.1 hypothetical protein PC114_g4660 [Phytophthora cactorum]KAG2938201.1 hypothetical protein PC115_g3837 [Phytophthora cactorum]